jgi:hypothetical protein
MDICTLVRSGRGGPVRAGGGSVSDGMTGGKKDQEMNEAG